MGRAKITVVGAGNVGASCAMWITAHELGDVVLVDIVEGAAKGKALDLLEAAPVNKFDIRIVGSAGYEETANSDVVVITAGVPRKKDPVTGKPAKKKELIQEFRKALAQRGHDHRQQPARRHVPRRP